jgi:hypothetical protein
LLLVSTIANNDLGWRAVLPAVLVLTVFAAATLSTRPTPSPTIAAAIGLFALDLVGGASFIHTNATGNPASSASAIAQSRALWRAVRRHAAPDQRVGNNPAAFADLFAWPIKSPGPCSPIAAPATRAGRWRKPSSLCPRPKTTRWMRCSCGGDADESGGDAPACP